jgi:SAM-dependent methyltransferase
MSDDFNKYFSGEVLYGDDFNQEQILSWFFDEAEGYAGLLPDENEYSYSYHALNQRHAFNFIKKLTFNNGLGIGSAFGDEFRPLADKINSITILDPSDKFSNVDSIHGVPCTFKKPKFNGDMDFNSCNFDLITSLGVMHHIPNVSHVINECYRVLSKNGIMLLREPITSMGDWREPRYGLTKRERGIPLAILDDILSKAGFEVLNRAVCNFPVIPKISNKFNFPAYNNHFLTAIDGWLSRLFLWNSKYHRSGLIDRFAPASVFYVLTKR